VARPPEPIFLARETYRRRRLIDAMRLLPVLGIGFFMVPMLDAGHRATAPGGIYVFAVWFLLIVAAAVLTRGLARGADGVSADPLEPGAPPSPGAAGGTERAEE